jgi:DsbC/DsbD-like thiol-disulfide interchange protein
MNRRAMISSLMGLPFAGRLAQAGTPQPYRVSLIGGAFDGRVWQAGVAIDLDEGWKTYWRMPGEAGIPPQFDWTKSTGVTGVEVLYPLPGRLHDLSGETIGFERRVVFPVIVTPAADATDVRLQLDLLFAVCKDVCIPAKARGTLALGNANSDTDVVEEWIGRVPVPGTVVRSVTATMDADAVVLVLELSQEATDIFVESESAAYFRKPAFSADGLEARLVVNNTKDAAELKGMVLKLTLASGPSGIEQAVTVE